MAAESELERNLCVIKKAFAFKVPPASSAAGHKAEAWSKVPIWTGRLRVVAVGEKMKILLEHADKEGLFLSCPVTPNKTVEPVLDSSRYFVLRVEDGKGGAAYLGIGFQNRDEAFDFKSALQDFENQSNAKQHLDEIVAAQPTQDFSLPEGATIRVNINTKKTKKKDDEEKDSGGASKPATPAPAAAAAGAAKAAGGFGLAPPPKKGEQRKRVPAAAGGGGGAGSGTTADVLDLADSFGAVSVAAPAPKDDDPWKELAAASKPAAKKP